jgi:rare lipoprotein A (peptidoglycan hydrolase)
LCFQPVPVISVPLICNTGIASWYDYNLKGIEWSREHNTAASRSFKRYSTVIVKNIETGKEIEVYINDYGPEEWTGREIDLSSHAFKELAPLNKGLINVSVKYK